MAPQPKGTIIGKDVPANVQPGSMFAMGVWFRNDAAVSYAYQAHFVAKGKNTGRTYIDARSVRESISPGRDRALSSGTQFMPSEPLLVAITVEAV